MRDAPVELPEMEHESFDEWEKWRLTDPEFRKVVARLESSYQKERQRIIDQLRKVDYAKCRDKT